MIIDEILLINTFVWIYEKIKHNQSKEGRNQKADPHDLPKISGRVAFFGFAQFHFVCAWNISLNHGERGQKISANKKQ